MSCAFCQSVTPRDLRISCFPINQARRKFRGGSIGFDPSREREVPVGSRKFRPEYLGSGSIFGGALSFCGGTAAVRKDDAAATLKFGLPPLVVAS